MKVQKGLQRTLSCPLAKLSSLRDRTPLFDMTLSDVAKMLNSTDDKQGPPLYSESEIPNTEDDRGSCSGSTHKVRAVLFLFPVA